MKYIMLTCVLRQVLCDTLKFSNILFTFHAAWHKVIFRLISSLIRSSCENVIFLKNSETIIPLEGLVNFEICYQVRNFILFNLSFTISIWPNRFNSWTSKRSENNSLTQWYSIKGIIFLSTATWLIFQAESYNAWKR